MNEYTPITERNEHFNPEDYDTEVFGFFEELIAFDNSAAYEYRTLGTRRLVGLPNRPMGSAGRIIVELKETITLTKGHKTVTIRIKPGQVIKCFSMIQPLCGRRELSNPALATPLI